MRVQQKVASSLMQNPLTIVLLVVSIGFSLASGFGASGRVLSPFLIALPGSSFLAEVRAGEFWRLLTPVFLHFGILHISFNMLWLWDLGTLLEPRRGKVFLAAFVAVVGIASNLAQYLMTGSPVFGGMSGVVYGLLGYIWMQGRYNPHAGYRLHKQIVVMMLAWYLLCWTGLLGPIANWAHTGGLAMGVLWGFLDRSANVSGR